MINLTKTSEQSGRSMVEMLGVLAIVGVLSIGGIAGYSKAMAKYKVNKTLDQISLLITNIRTTYGNQNDYAGLTNATAITYGIAGADIQTGSTSKLMNAFGGSIDITAGNYQTDKYDWQGDAKGYFNITIDNVEKVACATIMSADWGSSAASGLMGIAIGTGDDNLYTWTNTSRKLPLTWDTAFTKCSSVAGTAGNTSLRWIYN